MRAVIDIAINDLRIIFKDRSVWINLVVIPLVIAYIIGVVNSGGGGGTPNLIIDVIDNDGGALSQQFLSDLKAANPNFVLCPADDTDGACELGGAAFDEALAEQRLQDQTSLALIEIPASFSVDIDAGENVSIVYRSNEDASAPSYILQAVQAETQRLGGALTAARVGSDVAGSLLDFADDADRAAFADTVRENAGALWAQNPAQVEYVVGEQTETEQAAGPGFKQSIPGIGTMYAMFIVLPAAAAIILERKTWTLQRLAVMPISRAQILGGKLLARFATGMLEYALMFAFGLVLGVRYGDDPLAILLLAVTFTLAVTALTLALTGLLKNQAQAQGISLFLTLTLAPLGGAWWPLDIVPAWLRTVGHISPVAWVMDGFTSVVVHGGNLGTVVTPILVLLGMTVVFFAIGVRRFKFTD